MKKPEPAKIVIDGRMLSWTGVGRYTHHLLEELQQLDKVNMYTVLVLPSDNWQPTASNFRRVEANFKPYGLGEQAGLRRLLNRLQADVVHFTAPNSPLFYTGRRVTTIHDLTLIDYKNVKGSRLLYEIKYQVFGMVMSRAVKSSMFVLTITDYVKSQLLERYKIKHNKVHTTHLAADLKVIKPVKEKYINGPYLLYVGNFFPYKNIGQLIEALPGVVEKNPNIKLVLVGREDYFQAQLKKQAKELGVEDKVVFTGFVSDQELAGLYQNATLYTFPSLSEGFGLPALEAMSYGVPIAAARASCLPEVLGASAEYFDPYNANDIAKTINSLLGNKKRLSELKKAGPEHVKSFSWKRTAEQTLEVYRRALGQK
ncbi:MAG TPA: glycosyltransferase family 1 protein [Candidatus Dormibacteraeota bacterium]|nr:glycosyltransferase family 1 protein [Candidatus Dormibacteraeota bacterium]